MGTQNKEHEIQLLEIQLQNKTAEFAQALKNGAVFEDLKKIHLEKKALARKLQLSKELNTAVINQPIPYFGRATIA